MAQYQNFGPIARAPSRFGGLARTGTFTVLGAGTGLAYGHFLGYQRRLREEVMELLCNIDIPTQQARIRERSSPEFLAAVDAKAKEENDPGFAVHIRHETELLKICAKRAEEFQERYGKRYPKHDWCWLPRGPGDH